MNSPNKKEILKIIQARIMENKPRQEILNELTDTGIRKSKAAKLIAMIPDNKIKEKYKFLNYVLLGSLITFLAGSMYAGFLYYGGFKYYAEEPVLAILGSLAILLIFAYLVYGVSRFRGYIYNEVTFLGILGLWSSLADISEFGILDIVLVLFVLICAGLSVYLRKKMFPNYGLWGLKKDQNEDLLLE